MNDLAVRFYLVFFLTRSLWRSSLTTCYLPHSLLYLMFRLRVMLWFHRQSCSSSKRRRKSGRSLSRLLSQQIRYNIYKYKSGNMDTFCITVLQELCYGIVLLSFKLSFASNLQNIWLTDVQRTSCLLIIIVGKHERLFRDACCPTEYDSIHWSWLISNFLPEA